jgi:hypothetical protein
MKKLLHKLRKRKELPPSSRITSETVAEHREHILAGGRRFKYPIQYARHKLVINAIIISVVALIVVLALGWWQLYKAQNTSEFMYRVTKVIPVPVAAVDGQPVLYSDYLMKYLSSVHYLEQKEQVSIKTENGKRQVDYIKQQSLQDAIADAYAMKLAKNLGVSISDIELEGFIKSQRQSSDGEISEQTYNAVILDYYGWSPAEFRYVTKNKLLRQKVAYTMDKAALSAANSVVANIKKDIATDFKTLAATVSAQSKVKAVYGVSGLVPKTNQDGGLAIEAAKLIKLETSGVIKSTIGDGYYIIKLLDSNDTKVSYEYIKIPLTAFTKSLDDVIKSGKISKYISV